MDIKALRLYVEKHPAGVLIRMIDGTEYEIPHRDYIWFTPVFGERDTKTARVGTSFWLADAKTEEYRLVNALLVKDVLPMSNGRGKGRKRSA